MRATGGRSIESYLQSFTVLRPRWPQFPAGTFQNTLSSLPMQKRAFHPLMQSLKLKLMSVRAIVAALSSSLRSTAIRTCVYLSFRLWNTSRCRIQVISAIIMNVESWIKTHITGTAQIWPLKPAMIPPQLRDWPVTCHGKHVITEASCHHIAYQLQTGQKSPCSFKFCWAANLRRVQAGSLFYLL